MILFHSWSFLEFFLITFLVYWISPKKFRNFVLLIASFIFYASWDWRLLGLMILVIFLNYFFSLLIHKKANILIKRVYLILPIILTFGILIFFKYFNFLLENILVLLNSFGGSFKFNALSIILPVGISFYTFQAISYTIDVYRKKTIPVKSLIDFFLYISYFPQLIAGPIERAEHLLPQIQSNRLFRNIRFKEGAYLFLYGLFKKVVIADFVGITVDVIFKQSNIAGSHVLLGAYLFAIQIYCDFSGYTTMARGISKFFCIDLNENFNLPYFSKNPSEFWKRWHITLSSWVKDYIYIPLGGSRTWIYGLFPLFVTMIIMGFWHGAAWNFVLWGLYWFAITMIYRILKKLGIFDWFYNLFNCKIWVNFVNIFAILLMFHLTCYSWIIFRANSINQILSFTKSLIFDFNLLDLIGPGYFQIFCVLLFLIIYEFIQYKNNDHLIILKAGFFKKLIFWLIILFFWINNHVIVDTGFIYFQF